MTALLPPLRIVDTKEYSLLLVPPTTVLVDYGLPFRDRWMANQHGVNDPSYSLPDHVFRARRLVGFLVDCKCPCDEGLGGLSRNDIRRGPFGLYPRGSYPRPIVPE